MFFFNSAKTFKGGIHPDEQKALSENCSFELMPNAKQIIIPISQHAGKPARILVQKGAEVKIGEIIAEAEGYVSSPIHSPVAGKVIKINMNPNSSGFYKAG